MQIRGKEFSKAGRRKGQDRSDRLSNSQPEFDKTHGLIAAGMPKIGGPSWDDDDPVEMGKILPVIVRPILKRAIGSRGV